MEGGSGGKFRARQSSRGKEGDRPWKDARGAGTAGDDAKEAGVVGTGQRIKGRRKKEKTRGGELMEALCEKDKEESEGGQSESRLCGR